MVDQTLMNAYLAEHHASVIGSPVGRWSIEHVGRLMNQLNPHQRWEALSRYANRNQLVSNALSPSTIARPEEVSWSDLFECEQCGQRQSQYTQLQTRGADEPMATFIVCVCEHRWREE